MLRPFCRATNGTNTCHRMKGHSGPHIERTWRVDLRRNGIDAVRWFDTVEYTGPEGVPNSA